MYIHTHTYTNQVSRLFSAFDEVVEKAGMFKYQHVSQGDSFLYIVACPRVACPFDEAQQVHCVFFFFIHGWVAASGVFF